MAIERPQLPPQNRDTSKAPNVDSIMDSVFDDSTDSDIATAVAEAGGDQKSPARTKPSDGTAKGEAGKPKTGFVSFEEAKKGKGAEDIEGKKPDRSVGSARKVAAAKPEVKDEDRSDGSDDELDDEDLEADVDPGSEDETDDDGSEADDDFDPFGDEDDELADSKPKITPFSTHELQAIRAARMSTEEANELLSMGKDERALVIRAAIRQAQKFRRAASGLEPDQRARLLGGLSGSDDGETDGTASDGGEPDQLDQIIGTYAESTGQDAAQVKRFAKAIASATLAQISPSLDAAQQERAESMKRAARAGIVAARATLIKQIPSLADKTKFRKVWDSNIVGATAKAYMEQGLDAQTAVRRAVVERARGLYAGHLQAAATKKAESSRAQSLRRTPDPGSPVKRAAGGRERGLNAILDESFDELVSSRKN